MRKNTPCFRTTKSCNSKSFNPIFTKKYTDHLTIIRNNYYKFHEIWISCFQVTSAWQTDGQTDRPIAKNVVYKNRQKHKFLNWPIHCKNITSTRLMCSLDIIKLKITSVAFSKYIIWLEKNNVAFSKYIKRLGTNINSVVYS